MKASQRESLSSVLYPELLYFEIFQTFIEQRRIFHVGAASVYFWTGVHSLRYKAS